MSLGANILHANIDYASDTVINVFDNLVTKFVVAPFSDSETNDLFLGASKDLVMQALENVKVTLGSSNNLSIYDNTSNISFNLLTETTKTFLSSGSKDLYIGNDSNDVFIQSLQFSSDSTYQTISTSKPAGLKFDDNVYIVGSQLIQGGVSVGGNIITNSNVFAANYNLYRQKEVINSNDSSLVGYAFTINSNTDMLELLKYANFSNNQVVKKIAVFGRNMLSNTDVSDASYLEFNGLGIDFINGDSSTPIAGVDGSLADGAVTTIKIADSNITDAKIDRSTVGVWEVSESNNSNIFYKVGSVGIGMSNPRPEYVLDIVGEAHIVGTFSSTSDIRMKKDIESITDALSKIDKIGGYTYVMKNDPKEKRIAGVVAQEMQQVLPEVVTTDQEGNLSVAYPNIVSLLIEGIKELNKKFDKFTQAAILR